MLCITTNEGSVNWHTGERRPVVSGRICEVSADCDELEHIRRTMTGIRMTKARVVRWYGDEAKFIANNL